jgi:hypothetical protein
MPDFRYRQTTVTLDVRGFEFRAAGRQPIELGWRAAFPEWQAERRKALIDDAERQNAEWLDLESEKLDGYAEDLERAFETEIKAAEAEIREAKKALRGSNLPMTEKVAEKRRISNLEGKRDKLKAEFFDRRATIRAEVEAMLDKIQESLKLEPTLTDLFTIRWEVA